MLSHYMCANDVSCVGLLLGQRHFLYAKDAETVTDFGAINCGIVILNRGGLAIVVFSHRI